MASSDMKADPLFLTHYDTLQKTGLWDKLTELQSENRELKELVSDALVLFSETNIEKMIDFVLGRMLNKFIPSFLCFFLEPARGGRIKSYFFRNMKPLEDSYDCPDYQAFKDFFIQYPKALAFSILEYQLGDKEATDRLLPFNPEFVIPMTGIGGVSGFVVFGKKVVDQGYDRTEIEYAFRIMKVLAIASQSVLYHESSITDFKTGLFNHSFFMRRFDQELARVTQHRTKAGLILMDLDHFKRLNDNYGHLAGDEVLAAVARTVQQTIRSEDVAARFGGEEFTVLAIECSEPILPLVAERIRKAVEKLRVPYKTDNLAVTVSLGCCMLDGGDKIRPGEYIDRADVALYRSKTGGRNRTTLYRRGLLFKAAGLRASEGC